MKSLFLTSLFGLVAAQAVPESSFYLASILAGYSGGCSRAQDLRFNIDTQSMNIEYFGMGTPQDRGAAVCVLLYDLVAPPSGWRYAIESVRHTGHAKFPQGTNVTTFGFYIGNSLRWVLNPQDPYTEFNWSVNSDTYGSFDAAIPNWALNADYDSDFDLLVKPNDGQLHWSPCSKGPEENSQEQLWSQTHVYWTTPEGVEKTGFFAGGSNGVAGLKSKLNLVWEKCDPVQSPYATWGRHLRIDTTQPSCAATKRIRRDFL